MSRPAATYPNSTPGPQMCVIETERTESSDGMKMLQGHQLSERPCVLKTFTTVSKRRQYHLYLWGGLMTDERERRDGLKAGLKEF